ncbi:DUF6573 family protein [Nonomuraea sp. NPDC049646]|uniref:DUF6573 family protein n=1 Tax=unclassified Nonomuraea TaxID=2593643 RepID=UPI0037B4E907
MTSNSEQLISKIDSLIGGFVDHDDTVSPVAMRCAPQPVASDGNPFAGLTVISAYTRADMIADGLLIEVPAHLVREVAFRAPVAITCAAWEDCVAWTCDDNARKGICNDETGRLWDVLWMARMAVRRASGDASRVRFSLYRVPRPGSARAPRQVWLDIVAGPGDHGELVLTIMRPDED